MPGTILEIAKEAAERDATAPAPVTLFETNNRIAKILRGAAHDTMREYLRASGWQGMSEFQSTWIFSLIPGRFAYPLPPDFLRTVPGTEQRNGWPLGLIGPSSPQSWAHWIYGNDSSAVPMGWRIRNNAIWVDPTPQSAELMAIEYITRYPVVSEIRAGDYDLTTDPLQTIAPIVPRDGHLDLPNADVVYDSKGATSSEQDGEYDEDPGYDEAVWPQEPEEILKRINPMATQYVLPEVRRPEFTADTDRPAFDDDFLLSLGMTFRLRRALGMAYVEHAAEYEEELSVKAASDAGGPSDIHLDRDCRRTEQVYVGNGKWIID